MWAPAAVAGAAAGAPLRRRRLGPHSGYGGLRSGSCQLDLDVAVQLVEADLARHLWLTRSQQVSVYLLVPLMGPLPAVYEPFWYTEKVVAAGAAAVAAVAALVALSLQLSLEGNFAGTPRQMMHSHCYRRPTGATAQRSERDTT